MINFDQLQTMTIESSNKPNSLFRSRQLHKITNQQMIKHQSNSNRVCQGLKINTKKLPLDFFTSQKFASSTLSPPTILISLPSQNTSTCCPPSSETGLQRIPKTKGPFKKIFQRKGKLSMKVKKEYMDTEETLTPPRSSQEPRKKLSEKLSPGDYRGRGSIRYNQSEMLGSVERQKRVMQKGVWDKDCLAITFFNGRSSSLPPLIYPY